MWTVGLSDTFRYIPSLPSFCWAFIMKGCWILSKSFLYLLSWSCGFRPLFCLRLYHIYWFMCVDHPHIPGWSHIDHGIWSFWCVAEFSLQVFCPSYFQFWYSFFHLILSTDSVLYYIFTWFIELFISTVFFSGSQFPWWISPARCWLSYLTKSWINFLT
jgi:hypothetical protein